MRRAKDEQFSRETKERFSADKHFHKDKIMHKTTQRNAWQLKSLDCQTSLCVSVIYTLNRELKVKRNQRKAFREQSYLRAGCDYSHSRAFRY